MTHNRLASESSPYLVQHKDNPVHWWPWGSEALVAAKNANKPILLSVGYAACHWCHVMAHESFEDPATADVMNRLFINIKVDREERPDIDKIYMTALQATGEQGGWPLTMFLTPDAKPIWGGTYFPNTTRYGRPSFVDVLQEVSRVFHEKPDVIETNSAALTAALAARPQSDSSHTLDEDFLKRAAIQLTGLFDPVHGGIRGAPKFPQASVLQFLWQSRSTDNDQSQDMVLLTLRNICQGGIYDHLAGGFARYSVDDRWLVPHFEKMLYDNAQLVSLLVQAYASTGDPLFRDRITETVDWMIREMRTEEGAFSSAIDADSEGVEGKFYVWTEADIDKILSSHERDLFKEIYDVSAIGNWEGTTILNRLSAQDPLSEDNESILQSARSKLLGVRNERIRPQTDDKVLTDWNGLAIAAIADAATILNRRDWLEHAVTAFEFLTAEPINRSGRLCHSYREGKMVYPGLATDYANLALAALALYRATFETKYITFAEAITQSARTHHWDAQRPGYFLPADDAEALIIRPRSDIDEATPSATSVMAAVLVRLWRLTGKDTYRTDADAILQAAAGDIPTNLFAYAGLLTALDLRLGAIDIVIIAPEGSDPRPHLAAVAPFPRTVVQLHSGTDSIAASHPAYGKSAVRDQPTVYVCRGETCSLPITAPDDITAAINGSILPS